MVAEIPQIFTAVLIHCNAMGDICGEIPHQKQKTKFAFNVQISLWIFGTDFKPIPPHNFDVICECSLPMNVLYKVNIKF